jgi:polyphosphate kinase
MAGVKIDLIVRGICALRPGIAGISDNISVRSIIGRFLEHSRVFYFHNDGNSDIYCASADWMERNFFRRIEVAFPIERKQHRERILQDLDTYLTDCSETWLLQADGSYERLPCTTIKHSAQESLLQRYAEGTPETFLAAG